jgi:hypothetical protein
MRERMQTNKSENRQDDPDDLLWGAKAIADDLNIPLRRAFYLLEQGLIPASKIGSLWVAGRRKLRSHILGA